MPNLLFNSYEYFDHLRRAGVPAEQAAVHAETLGEVLYVPVAMPDLLKAEFRMSRAFDLGRMEMEVSFEKLHRDMKVLKVMMGSLICLTLPVFFKVFFA